MSPDQIQTESSGLGLASGKTTRRDLLKAGAAGAVAVGTGGFAVAELAGQPQRAVAAVPGVLDVYINEGYVPMVDGSLVYMRGYGERPTRIDDPAPSLTLSPRVFLANGSLVESRVYPSDAEVPVEGRPTAALKQDGSGFYLLKRAHWASFFPARTIVAETGSQIRLRVHNGLRGAHRLHVPDVVDTGPIAPGGSVGVSFAAPATGTYIYSDTGNGSVERVLGLNGVLVVVPHDDRWRLSPGGTEFERQWLWICHDIDPEWGRRANAGETIDPVATPAAPRYFMLNGRSGFLSLGVSEDDAVNLATHEETLLSGYPRDVDVRDFSLPDSQGSVVTGQLIRLVNVGAVIHQMHFHGNHVWTVRRNGSDFPRDAASAHIDDDGHVAMQQWEDVVELDPLDRKEIVLPVRRPPEAIDQVWDARTEDWHYPMHCHAEPSQTAAGGLYPGGMVADWILAGQNRVEHPHFRSQVEFASKQHDEGHPETEFRQPPDRTFQFGFFNRRLSFPDRSAHEMWSFEDGGSGRSFPAPLIRPTEGEIVHLVLKPSKRAHTIHLHGMEPDPRNDGVGHTSFEVSGEYTYQWRPEPGVPGDPGRGAAGSYFYHCHVNTVLHVQMGMVGPMIIDPVVHPDYPVPAGGRRSFVDGPVYDVETEMMLVPYSLDPRWHTLNHAAGLSGEDVGLNRFEPKHFYVLGGEVAKGAPRDAVWSATQQRAHVAGGSGFPTLLRVLNLNYFPTRIRFTSPDGAPARIAELIAHDGRPFRDTSSPTGPSRPPRDLGNRLLTSTLMFGAAERYDMLLHPPTVGQYTVHFDWLHWVEELRPQLIATRSVPLTVA